MMLCPGQKLASTPNNPPLVIGELLGVGGQGEIYRARQGGREVAVKWISPGWASPEYKRALGTLASMSAPDHRFLWPDQLLTAGDIPSFGYVMPLVEPRFVTISSVVVGEISPSLSVRAKAAREIVAAFRSLHSKGLCYRDISDDNISLDPLTGEVCIADNDNVAVDGEGAIPIAGTPGFAAPEVIRGEAKPSAEADLWSLAVLLFHLLFNSHPLEGAREAAIHCKDRDAIMSLYGHGVFIYDPKDASNRPVPGLHDGSVRLWPMYPSCLRALFTRAFTDGMLPGQRVRESEWHKALGMLEDSITRCTCGAENIWDHEISTARFPCWRCQTRLSKPMILHSGDRAIVLSKGKTLHECHTVDPRSQGHASAITAEVVTGSASSVALLNRSTRNWTASLGKACAEVRPGQRVALQRGLRIDFGSRIASVR